MVLPVFPRNISYRARPKSPPFQFFSALRDIFFSDFFSKFFFLEGSPLHFFDVLRQNGCWKIPKGSSFQFYSALWDFLPKIKFFSSIFSCFATEWMLKNLKGSPLSVFRHCETLARQGLAVASPGAPLGPFLVCNFSKKISKNFRFSTTVNEYLTLGELFAIFEPWIWRRLGPVPACYFLNVTYKTGRDWRPPFPLFPALCDFSNFFCLQRVQPLILLKSPFVISWLKRYIRTFDVISELYCVFIISASAGILLNLKMSTFFSTILRMILNNSDILFGNDCKREN